MSTMRLSSRFAGVIRLATLAGLALAAGCKREPPEVPPPVAPVAPPAAVKAAAAASPASPCPEICRIARDLRCKNQAECEPRCQSMLSLPACKEELFAFLTCLRRQPAANWECDSEDIPAIRDPFCDRQQAALAACMESSPARSPR
jgi:hypothetical protein